MVARGFRQREGVDFFDTYSPCPLVSSIRLLTAIACDLDWDLCHFDAEQAFVQARLDEEVYIRLPQGCGALSDKVVRLGRSLYGLKQASRTWHFHLMKGMKRLGFEQCAADACVFRLIENGKVTLIVIVHVDDIFCAGVKSRCARFGADLNQYVPISNLGELRWYAGCRFSRDPVLGAITILQQAVAERLVAKFGVTETKDIPMLVGLKLDEFDRDEPDVLHPFRSLVGSLMWLANQTRPDILNAVRAVSRYSQAPKLVHWKAALHILMYVKGTSGYGITFQRDSQGPARLEVYSDSDFASRETSRRSVSGVVVMCAGACVSFLSRTQQCVTLSSCEAEYVAMALGFKEGIFLRFLWQFFFPFRPMVRTFVYEDNVGAVHLATYPATTPNSKHIDIRHHFLRERVSNGEFQVVHVPSALQHADFLTKPLPVDAFRRHRDFVMNIS